jgi:hypothetical protein
VYPPPRCCRLQRPEREVVPRRIVEGNRLVYEVVGASLVPNSVPGRKPERGCREGFEHHRVVGVDRQLHVAARHRWIVGVDRDRRWDLGEIALTDAVADRIVRARHLEQVHVEQTRFDTLDDHPMMVPLILARACGDGTAITELPERVRDAHQKPCVVGAGLVIGQRKSVPLVIVYCQKGIGHKSRPFAALSGFLVRPRAVPSGPGAKRRGGGRAPRSLHTARSVRESSADLRVGRFETRGRTVRLSCRGRLQKR